MNDVLRRIWKEAIVDYFKVVLQPSLAETKEEHRCP
jgi:hypothetical protein